MPSNLRFVSQLFRGGRSIGPRGSFSSPPKNDESNRAGTIGGFGKFLMQVGAGLTTGYLLGLVVTGDAASIGEKKQRKLFEE